MRRSVSFNRMPYSPQTSVVPLMLPPVGHFGRPFLDLVDSPALGASQSSVRGVEEKARVWDCWAWEQSAWRALRRPGLVSWVKTLTWNGGEGIQQALVVKDEEEDSADMGAHIVAILSGSQSRRWNVVISSC